jgi:hypothetical protein
MTYFEKKKNWDPYYVQPGFDLEFFSNIFVLPRPTANKTYPLISDISKIAKN